MENLQSLLDSVNAILREEKIKKEESLRRGERFNVFQICGVAHYEVMHSTIIASFLAPNGSHGQKDLFLRLFFDVIGNNIKINTSKASVYTEYVIEEGRIDILVEDDKGKGVIIENKIYASDQDEQLIRYNRFAKDRYKNGYTIYYLTLTGCDASENSSKDVDYTRISYTEHIISWIRTCIKESSTTPLIRETLVQYYNHLKQLTNQDMETKNKEDLLKKMADNADAVALIGKTLDSYKEYVFKKYVEESDIITNFCKTHNLIFKQCKLFDGKSGKGFYFYKKEWKSASIWIYTDRSGEWDFYWGVSNYADELVIDFKKMDCFSNSPIKYWPYGWEWLKKYRVWDWNVYTEMVNGNFASYVVELVSQAIEEIERKKLPMP